MEWMDFMKTSLHKSIHHVPSALGDIMVSFIGERMDGWTGGQSDADSNSRHLMDQARYTKYFRSSEILFFPIRKQRIPEARGTAEDRKGSVEG